MYITICDTECPYKQENGTSVSHKNVRSLNSGKSSHRCNMFLNASLSLSDDTAHAKKHATLAGTDARHALQNH